MSCLYNIGSHIFIARLFLTFNEVLTCNVLLLIFLATYVCFSYVYVPNLCIYHVNDDHVSSTYLHIKRKLQKHSVSSKKAFERKSVDVVDQIAIFKSYVAAEHSRYYSFKCQNKVK